MKKIKILAIICALAMTTNVHAALQSRPGIRAKEGGTYATTFYKLIREMETENGALGLNATFEINSTTKEFEEISPINNIDSHMMKNTEWGAIAMLSASDYGAGNGNVSATYNKNTNIYDVTASTTGNMSGIFGMNGGSTLYEYTAGGIISSMENYKHGYLMNASNRYIDKYDYSTDSKDFERYIPGDATYETRTFAGGAGNFVHNNYPIFDRGYSGIFHSLSYLSGANGSWNTGARVAVWVGDGI